MNSKESTELIDNTKMTIPTVEALDEVMSRKFYKPKVIKIPKNSRRAVALQKELWMKISCLKSLPTKEKLIEALAKMKGIPIIDLVFANIDKNFKYKI